MLIRPENDTDVGSIRSLIMAAFINAEHTDGTEANIVDRLRESDGLTVSLVAIDDDEVVGHVAFSSVMIGEEAGYYGLGPVAVRHDHRQQGIGAALVRAGLDRLREEGAKGCVVLGDPAYYQRFGFTHDKGVTLAGVPAEYFQVLRLTDDRTLGAVGYHPAFGIE